MSKFKLTYKESYLLCGILQFLVGIFYFTYKKNVSFLIIFILLGIFLTLLPYLENVLNTKSHSQSNEKNKKTDQFMGIGSICVGILSFLLVPSDSIFIFFIDTGLISLILSLRD
jgi:uncharacterized membrane protein HdeD (DUF308 family)